MIKSNQTAEEVVSGIALTRHVYVVTGANSGMGFETARVLALQGATVYVLARTKQKAKEASLKLPGDTRPIACDLAELSKIEAVAQQINGPIDGIIACAGVMALPERKLKYEIEMHFLINHMGHFMLVNALKDRLSPTGRIVVYSSAAHTFAKGKKLGFKDVTFQEGYTPWKAYGYSKLANILFTKYLSTTLSVGQTANSLHPGIVATNLFRHQPEAAIKYKFKPVEVGASLGVFLATNPRVQGITGAYFSGGKIGKPYAAANDGTLARQLWETSENIARKLN